MKLKIKNNLINQKGQAVLFIVLIIMFALFFIGLSLTNMIFNQTKTTRNIYLSTQAYYLSDSGTEIILYKTRGTGEINPSVDPSPLISGNVDFNEDGIVDGYFEVIRESSSPLRLKTIGKYNKTSRSIELSWENN